MANMKQQIKRYKNDNKKRAKNASYKSALKTAIKNVRAEVEAGNKEAAEKALVIASSKLPPTKILCLPISSHTFWKSKLYVFPG